MWRWKAGARGLGLPHVRSSSSLMLARLSSLGGALCPSAASVTATHGQATSLRAIIKPGSLECLLHRSFSSISSSGSNNKRNNNDNDSTLQRRQPLRSKSETGNSSWDDTLPPPKLDDVIKVPKGVDPFPRKSLKSPATPLTPPTPSRKNSSNSQHSTPASTTKRDENTPRAQGDDWNEPPRVVADVKKELKSARKADLIRMRSEREQPSNNENEALRDASASGEYNRPKFAHKQIVARPAAPLTRKALVMRLYKAGVILKVTYEGSEHSQPVVLLHRIHQLREESRSLPKWRQTGAVPDANTKFTEQQRKFADTLCMTLTRLLEMQREGVGLTPFVTESQKPAAATMTAAASSRAAASAKSAPSAPQSVAPVSPSSRYASILDADGTESQPTAVSLPLSFDLTQTFSSKAPFFILISFHYSSFLRLLRCIPPPLLPLSMINNLWMHMLSQRTMPPKWESVTGYAFLPFTPSIRHVNVILDLYASLGAWEQLWAVWQWLLSQPTLQPSMITINIMLSALIRQMDAKMRELVRAQQLDRGVPQGALFETSARGFSAPTASDRARFESVWMEWKNISTRAPTAKPAVAIDTEVADMVEVAEEDEWDEDLGPAWAKLDYSWDSPHQQASSTEAETDDNTPSGDFIPSTASELADALKISDHTLPPFFEPLRKYFRSSQEKIVDHMLPVVPTVASMGDKRFHANLLKFHNMNSDSLRAAYWACVVMRNAHMDLGRGSGAIVATQPDSLLTTASTPTDNATTNLAATAANSSQDLSTFRQVYSTFHRELMRDSDTGGIGLYLSPRGKSEFEMQLWNFFTQTVGLKPDTHLVSLRMKLLVMLSHYKLAKRFAEQHAAHFSQTPSKPLNSADYNEADSPTVVDGKARSLFFENYLKSLSTLDVTEIVSGYRPSFNVLKSPLHPKSVEIIATNKSCPLPLGLFKNKNSSSIMNMQHLLNCYIREKILLPLAIPFHMQNTIPFTRDRFYTYLLEIYLKGVVAQANGVPLPHSVAFAQSTDKGQIAQKGLTQVSQIEASEFWTLYSHLYDRTFAQQVASRSDKGKSQDRSKHYVRLETFVLLLDRLPFAFATPSAAVPSSAPPTAETVAATLSSSTNAVPVIPPAAQAAAITLAQLVIEQAENMYRPLIENLAKRNPNVEQPWMQYREPVSVLYSSHINFVRVVNSYLAVLSRLTKNAQAPELAEKTYQHWFRAASKPVSVADPVVEPVDMEYPDDADMPAESSRTLAATPTSPTALLPRLQPLPHTLRALLSTYISAEKFDSIPVLLHSMQEQFKFAADLDLYEAAIIGFEGLCTANNADLPAARRLENRLRDARTAIRLYEEMLSKNLAPSAEVFTSLMAICEACDTVDSSSSSKTRSQPPSPAEENFIIEGKPNWKLSEELIQEMQKASKIVQMLKQEQRKGTSTSASTIPIELKKNFALEIEHFIPLFASYSRAGLKALDVALWNADEDERGEVLMESDSDPAKPLFFLNKAIKLLQHVDEASRETYGFVHMKVAAHPIIFQHIFQLWSRLSVECLQLAIDVPSQPLQTPLATAKDVVNVPLRVSELSLSTPVLPALFSVMQLFDPNGANTVLWNAQWEQLMKFSILYGTSLKALRSRAASGGATPNFESNALALDALISQAQTCMRSGWKLISNSDNLNSSMYAFQISNLAFARSTAAIAPDGRPAPSITTFDHVWSMFNSSQNLGVYASPELIHSIMVSMAHLKEYPNLFFLYRNIHQVRNLRIPITVHQSMMEWIVQWAKQSPKEIPSTLGEASDQTVLNAKEKFKAAQTFFTSSFESPFAAGRVLFFRRFTTPPKKHGAAVNDYDDEFEEEKEGQSRRASVPVSVPDYWRLYQLLLLEEKAISNATTSKHIHSAEVLELMETYFFDSGLWPHSRTQPHFLSLTPIVDGVRATLERSVQQLAQDASVDNSASRALTFLQADLRKSSSTVAAGPVGAPSRVTAPHLFEAVTSGMLVNDLLAEHIEAALSLWIVWLKARMVRFPNKQIKPLHVHISSIQSTSIDLHNFVQATAEAVLKRHGVKNVELVNLTLAQAHEAFPPLNRQVQSQARAGEFLKIDSKDL